MSQTDSFVIRILYNNLDDNQILHVDLPDTFVLSDIHGRQDVTGTVNDTTLFFSKSDSSDKTIRLTVPVLPCGEWQGDLPVSISLETNYPSNLLEYGNDLNLKLQDIDPVSIVFNGDTNEGTYIADVSMAKDGSILLYQDGDIAYISNFRQEDILVSEDMENAFKDLKNLQNIDLSHLDFSECERMSSMFENDLSLSNIVSLDQIDTSEVMYMDSLFAGCESLSSLKVNSWDVSNVTDLSAMFENCASLRSLSLASWDVSSCEDMSDLFAHCLSLTTTGNLSAWDLSSVTDLSGVFDSCTKLRNTGNLTSWDVSHVRSLSRLFRNCEKLSSVGDLSNWDVSGIRDFSYMFAGASALSGYGDIGQWQVSDQCQDLSYMFQNASAGLNAHADFSGWNVSNVISTSHMFENSSTLQSVNISGWDTSSLEDASAMFACFEETYLSPLTTVYGIEDIDTSSLQNISSMFYECQYFNADLSAWNTEGLRDISYAFYGTYRFDTGKLKHWNVSNVSDMQECFGDNAGYIIGAEIPEWYH